MNRQLRAVWHERYHVPSSGMISTVKAKHVMDRALRNQLLRVTPPTYPLDWLISRTHDPKYVKAVLTGRPRGLASSQGFKWSPMLATALQYIWAGQITASSLALADRGLILHPVSGAHHAMYDRGFGFCTFNFLVGAAMAFHDCRVAILDLDAHPGDGTLRLVEYHKLQERVRLFDISGSNWGAVSNTPGVVEYYEAKDRPGYWAALGKLSTFLKAVQPDLVFYQAGMDPHETDGVGGIPGMTATALEARDAFVLSLLKGTPTVVNFAGGYQPGITEDLHYTTVEQMMEMQW